MTVDLMDVSRALKFRIQARAITTNTTTMTYRRETQSPNFGIFSNRGTTQSRKARRARAIYVAWYADIACNVSM
jgi:hypothetical protein